MDNGNLSDEYVASVRERALSYAAQRTPYPDNALFNEAVAQFIATMPMNIRQDTCRFCRCLVCDQCGKCHTVRVEEDDEAKIVEPCKAFIEPQESCKARWEALIALNAIIDADIDADISEEVWKRRE